MRRMTAGWLALLVMLCAACGMLCGCSAGGDSMSVVTTVYAVYDIAKQLTAEYAAPCEVRLLLTPGGESHAFEPSPMDVSDVQRCDLFIYVGGESEQWAEKLVQSSRQAKANLCLFDSIPLLDEEDGDESDEHIWTSPQNAAEITAAIRDALLPLFPDEQAKTEAASQTLCAAFDALDAKAERIRQEAPGDTLVFADRFPFLYLTHAYGWKHYAAFSGCSSDTDASAANIAELIRLVQDEQIGTVFYLENSSRKIADAVCEATGAKAVMLQSGNNVSAADFQAEKHYQTIMEENLDAIREALS